MNLVLLAALTGYTITALTVTAIYMLTRWLGRVTSTLQAALYGTDENGNPNPRPADTQ